MATDLGSPGRRGWDAATWWGRYGGWIVLGGVVALATVVRLRFCAAGPDLDGDAVGHARIGRMLLARWADVRVHWVWLPLWHLVHAAATLLGSGIQQVRELNVALSTLPPFLLARALQRHTRAHPSGRAWLTRAEEWIPFVAGALLALWPVGLQIGASAQPEPLFQLAVLAACAAWERKEPARVGGWLVLASLLRYEAWLLPPVMFLLWTQRSRRTLREAQAWLWPGVAIVAWCALHWMQTHEPLQFLRVNREYVREAHAQLALPWAREGGLTRSLLRYAWTLPSADVRLAAWWMVPGAGWLAMRAPRSFRFVPLALLAFLTYAWARRLHLGLHRHLVVLLPFFATAIAAGACGTAAWLASRVRGPAGASAKAVRIAAAVLLAYVCLVQTVPAVRWDLGRYGRERRAERAAAAVLRANATGEARVFCDQAGVEVYSGLAPERFLRWRACDVAPFHLRAEARTHGRALVVAAPAQVTQLRTLARTLYDDGALVVLLHEAPAP